MSMAKSSAVLDLSTKHLRVIASVAHYNSFMAAAADLKVSQPTVSRLVLEVERRLGVLLFARTTRQVSLTAAGREFTLAAQRLLSDFTLQVEQARGLADQLRGRLVISSLTSITHHVLPAALQEYRKKHPHIEVQVREGLASQLHEDVRSGIADFAIGSATGLTEAIVVDARVRERCYAILPKGHHLAKQKMVSLHDLALEPMVSMPPESGLRRLVDGVAAANRLSLNHLTVVNQFGSMFDFVASGLGVSIAPASALSPQYTGVVGRPLGPPSIVREVGILRLTTRPLPPAARGFLEIFRPRFLAAARR
jgi:LysR family transcriptional regulator, carnitine catabolism transcriptional activator